MVSPEEITATVPPGSGTVDVRARVGKYLTPVYAADEFTYLTAPGLGSPSFVDVQSGFWAYNAIHELAAEGIVTGYPDGTFRPAAVVSRAQFVKMLVLTLHLQPDGASTSFVDVQTGSWYAPYVLAALHAGIVRAVTPTRFEPNAAITRQQVAAMLARALRLSRKVSLTFKDAGGVSPWALPFVQEAVAAGYLKGFPGNALKPEALTTRAQAAQILFAVLESAR